MADLNVVPGSIVNVYNAKKIIGTDDNGTRFEIHFCGRVHLEVVTETGVVPTFYADLVKEEMRYHKFPSPDQLPHYIEPGKE